MYYLENRKMRLLKKFSCIQFLKIYLKHKNSEKLEVQDNGVIKSPSVIKKIINGNAVIIEE